MAAREPTIRCGAVGRDLPSIPRPRVAALGDGDAPGDAVEVGFALEMEVAPLEELGEAGQDAAAGVGAVGPAAVGLRRARLVLDGEAELAADAVEGGRDRRPGARLAVAEGVSEHLAEEEAEAAGERTG